MIETLSTVVKKVRNTITTTMEEKPQIGLIDLLWNDIIFQKIFPLLELNDLFQLRATNSHYKHLVEEYFHHIKILHLYTEQLQSFPLVAFKVLSNCCTNIRKVNFTACSWLTDEVLIQFFSQNKNISEVNLNFCTQLSSKCLQPLIIHAKGLKVLRLKECLWFTSGCLETLTLHHDGLRIIDFSSTCVGDLNAMNAFIKKNKHLEKISVQNLQVITEETLLYIGKYCPNLRVLNIRECDLVSEKGLRNVVNSCENLEQLYLRGTKLRYDFMYELSRRVRVDNDNRSSHVFTIVKFPIRNVNFPLDDLP